MPRTRSAPRPTLRSSASLRSTSPRVPASYSAKQRFAAKDESGSAKQRFAAQHESPRPNLGRAEAGNRKRAATLPDLDRVIHERMRLAIVSALAANPSLSFIELKALLSTTDGNLSVHARKLEDAGYVAASKSFEGRIPRTDFRLTAEGRRAFERYLNHLEAVVHAGRKP